MEEQVLYREEIKNLKMPALNNLLLFLFLLGELPFITFEIWLHKSFLFGFILFILMFCKYIWRKKITRHIRLTDCLEKRLQNDKLEIIKNYKNAMSTLLWGRRFKEKVEIIELNQWSKSISGREGKEQWTSKKDEQNSKGKVA